MGISNMNILYCIIFQIAMVIFNNNAYIFISILLNYDGADFHANNPKKRS